MNTIITGASKGIGRGIAAVLAEAGHAVGLIARSEDLLTELVHEIESNGGRAAYAVADLRDQQQSEAAIASLSKALGGVEALVNNAAYVKLAGTLEIDPDDWRAMIETNVNGPFYCARAVLPAMRDRGRGHIVNIASVSGYMPLPARPGYAASKFALTGFSDSLFHEVRHWGVKVTTVFPGSVDTASHGSDEAGWKVSPEEVGRTVRHILETRQENLLSRVEIRPLARPS